ncbi:MAG: response regulator [Oligoflexales bacterium]|nr:response regulator [Oligoflexales bacterium]
MELTGRRILVIDDDLEIRELIKSILQSNGAFPVIAANATQALDIVASSQPFDVFLLDLIMPIGNGFDFIQSVRRTKKGHGVPIIVISGNLTTENVKKLAFMNIVASLTKPFTAQDLTDAIKNIASKDKNQGKKSGYDPRLVKCFVIATKEVVEYYLKKPANVEKPIQKNTNEACGFISSIITFSGRNIMGSMSLTFDKKFLPVLAKEVFMGEKVTLDEDLLKDLAGEINNQIMGKAKMNLIKLGFSMDLGLPSVIVGEKHTITHKTKNPIVMIPIDCDGSKCVVEFCMAEGAEIEECTDENITKPDVGIWAS